MIIRDISNNEIIKSLDDWKIDFFSSTKKKHWVKGRSAYECASYWLNENKVKELESLLHSKIEFTSFSEAYPECELKFDNYYHPRENDLLITTNDDKTIISVEAKTDEPFSNENYIDAFETALKAKKKNINSMQIERLLEIYTNYFCGNNEILNLRHQLAYWFSGSIAEGTRRNCKNLVFLNQVFISHKLNKTKLERNQKDFEFFAYLISNHEIKDIQRNVLYGPINNEYTKGLNVYILKQVINIEDEQ